MRIQFPESLETYLRPEEAIFGNIGSRVEATGACLFVCETYKG